MRRIALFALMGLLLAGVAAPLAPAAPARLDGKPQFRAYWVDAFGEGIASEAQIDKLVAAADAANMNALVVQVGRRGDCFCNRSIMPRTEEQLAPPPFDPLQTVIERAHARGIEVHAWLSATAVWRGATAPADPAHVFNAHGPTRPGRDNWLTVRADGATKAESDYYLDPGHPDAADYIVRMFTSIVANYDVDGINLDRIRYPDANLDGAGSAWGYNPTALARFQAQSGRSDTPAPADPQWRQWRRDQVTGIVRRVYLESTALKPGIRVSADTIAYGNAPERRGGWEGSSPYVEVLQDWRAWLEEGIVDLAIPMNYKRESLAAEPNNQRRMYEEWSDWAKDHQYRRAAAIGSALYLNSLDESLAQIRKALAPSAAGNASAGWVGYSYRVPGAEADSGGKPAESIRLDLARALTGAGGAGAALFADRVPAPPMPWKAQPSTGHLKGVVTGPDGKPLDGARVELGRGEPAAVIGPRPTDGSGWFGFVDLTPGQYTVTLSDNRADPSQAKAVTIEPGGVATVTLP